MCPVRRVLPTPHCLYVENSVESRMSAFVACRQRQWGLHRKGMDVWTEQTCRWQGKMYHCLVILFCAVWFDRAVILGLLFLLTSTANHCSSSRASERARERERERKTERQAGGLLGHVQIENLRFRTHQSCLDTLWVAQCILVNVQIVRSVDMDED